MSSAADLRTLITRLARLSDAQTWGDDLNPAQISALEYLSRANRFSRAPSHVADYLGTTRGTMSQTLKALMRKGYVTEARSDSDRRSIRYDLTDTGRQLMAQQHALAEATYALSDTDAAKLYQNLSALLKLQIEQAGGRHFGLCHTCAHHRPARDGAFCALLSLALSPEEPAQICHEHTDQT